MDATITAEQRFALLAASDLKGELVDFAQSPPLQRPWRQLFRTLAALDDDSTVRSVLATESLLFEFRYDDGSTVLDRFVARRPRLSDRQRGLVADWAASVFGIFEVTARDGDVLALHGLLDELPYVALASQGPESVEPFDEGSFMITRLLPVDGVWLLSGVQLFLPSELRADVARLVGEESLGSPGLVLRNPDKLRRARELTESLHASFLSCFGADRVVVPGPEAVTTYRRFLAHHRSRLGATAGMPPPAEPELSDGWGADLAECETVAFWHRADTGIWFFTEFQTVYDAFADPALAAEAGHRDVVYAYLTDDTVPPFVIEGLRAEFPHTAEEVLRTALGRPGFRWDRDGDALMRRHKAAHFQESAGLPTAVEMPSICRELVTAAGPSR